MTNTVLVGVGADFEQVFAHATGNSFFSVPVPPEGSVAALMAQMEGLPAPDVVVLDARRDPDASLELARQLTLERPVSVLLIAADPQQLGLAAMRSGVSDVIPADAAPEEVRRALEASTPSGPRRAAGWAQAGSEQLPKRPPGHVITFTSPKGGVGKTLASTNLAVSLAQAAPDSTVLVDLDLQFGDVATALNLTPESSVVDAVQGPASRDAMVLKTYLTRHDSGLYVLPAPDHPAAADDITAESIRHLLEMLATEVEHVVVDTTPGLSDQTLGALDATTDLVLVTALSVPGVRGLRKVLDTLNALKMFSSRRHVVMNCPTRGGGLSKADLEATLGGPIQLSLPFSKWALASLNAGVPLAVSRRRDPLMKTLRRFSGTFRSGK